MVCANRPVCFRFRGLLAARNAGVTALPCGTRIGARRRAGIARRVACAGGSAAEERVGVTAVEGRAIAASSAITLTASVRIPLGRVDPVRSTFMVLLPVS